MKKLLILLLMITALSMLASCEMLDAILGADETVDSTDNNQDDITDAPDDSGTTNLPGDTETPNTPDEPNTPVTPTYNYNAFTATEVKIFMTYIGDVIPFAPCDEYYVEGVESEEDYRYGINYYTIGNSLEDFNSYLALYSDYKLEEEYYDEVGDKWYRYVKGDVEAELCFYYTYGEFYIDVFVTSSLSEDTEDGEYLYNSFTADDIALFERYIGEVIPFVPNNEYYLEGYYDVDDYEHGINFYTFNNTEDDFYEYRKLFVGYTLTETYIDDYGDIWYCYEKDDIVVDLSFYAFDGSTVIDVFVYSSLSTDIEDDDTTGGSAGGGTDSSDVDIITNDGKGLPSDSDGVYDLDFTKAENVKDVTDQGYYLDGCPTVGSPKVLVIPVEFSDATASSKGYSISALKNAFNGAYGTTDYYSVYEYYYISSYGQLSLDITVLDNWFKPRYSSTYYASLTDSDGYSIGDQVIMDEALAYLETVMNLDDFDSDGNDIIDAVVLINTLDIGDDDFYWAYRYWNMYTDDMGYYYEYDGVSANDYLWASYQFLYYYDDETLDYDAMNTYTFIHEFGHVLGADDYYDTSYSGVHPMDGCDIMDSMTGDHNAYTKFNLGWLTSSRLVVTDSTVTLTLEDFSVNGDTIIIANNWDDTLGAYQEYYVLVYYTNNGLNSGDGNGYFARDGVVVYHVNASLYKEVYEGEIYYDIYNNNTDPSDEYGTEDNLIEFVLSDDGTYTYVAGDSIPANTLDDNGDSLAYTFTVDSLDANTATIIFTKN